MEKLGIYVHIPFCKQKCKYCDFISYNCDEEVHIEYLKCLNKEIIEKNIVLIEENNKMENKRISNAKWENEELESVNLENLKSKYKELNSRKITTIYIGGGTPSFINSKYIVEILDTIRKKYIISNDAEITIEVNPGTVTEEKLIDYKKAGINRLSIGLQSTNDEILKFIGRIHNYDEFLETYNLARKVGFENINVDLMLGIPNQTEDDVVDSINKIISLNPNHISLYSLILEDGTELENLVSKGKAKMPDENLERRMYWKTKNILEKNGYIHYEISNFAKNGFEAKHNTDCWNQEEYIGYGIAANSYFNEKRFSNTENLNEYIKNIKSNFVNENITIQEVQSGEDKKKEYMMLGLRKIDGVSISAFESKFRIHPLFYFRFEISKLVEEDLIEVDLDNIKLTKKGLDLANLVFEEFV